MHRLSLDFWKNSIIEREVPILDEEGKDTGKTEMKSFFYYQIGEFFYKILYI